ncbi:MAG TPA: calcium/proton exchanger [Gemmatimonadales bacterium]|nr:calcium/proton exchanger [Gemmatimonadales bacterium]
MHPHAMSESAQRALEQARAEAGRLGHESIGAEHILIALLSPGQAGAALAEGLGLDPKVVRGRLAAGRRPPRTRAAGHALPYTSHAKRLIETASRTAREAGLPLAAEHLLAAAFLEPRGPMGRVLADAGVSEARVRAELERIPLPGTPAGRARPAEGEVGPGPDAEPPRIAHGARGRPTWFSWRTLMLLALPVSIVLGYVLHAPAVWVFFTACLGVLPLAGYMGEATEHLAHRTGPTIGGLLNATFGNAAELIIAIVALRAGLVELVKASITGSILGNLLLILGLALIAGGLNRSELRFNRVNAGMSAGMLALAVAALVFPALFHALHPERAARLDELHMSEAVSVLLLATYGCSLLFTLKTHRRLFGGEAHPLAGPVWSVRRAVLVLAGATVGVAVESELLVHAATEATETLGLSPIFLGLIVIPIIGNAAEHAAAVVLSRKGQIDLGLQIALGSSTQVALLVAPLLVFAGLVLGQDMNLVFTPFEVLALGMATLVTAIITLDGESHWFEGVQLLAMYALVAAMAFFV